MTSRKNNFQLQLSFLCVLYFLLHIPFLFNGYGVEEDSWGLVVNAVEMFECKSYVASRLPGHPVHEYLLLWLYPNSPFTYNLISAISASIAVYLAALLFAKLNVEKPILAAFALGFCPVFFIAGTYTIDYTLALMLFLFAWYFITDNKIYWAALFLALSVGARITNCAMLLPMLFFIGLKPENSKKIFRFSLIVIVLSIMFYIPAINKYGASFFDYTDQFPYPNFPKFFYKATIGVFGFIGFCAIVVFLLKKLRTNEKVPFYVTLAIIIQIIAYIKLPQKSAYLIPLLPFLILFMSMKLVPRAFMFVCIAFIISGWMFGVQLVSETRGSQTTKNFNLKISGQKISFTPFTGNIVGDFNKREIKHDYAQHILQKSDTVSSHSAIICGWWYNQLLIENASRKKNNNVQFIFYCDADSLKKMFNSNCRVYYLEEQNIYNDLMFKMQQTNNYALSF